MNRRDFLKLASATTAAAMLPSVSFADERTLSEESNWIKVQLPSYQNDGIATVSVSSIFGNSLEIPLNGPTESFALSVLKNRISEVEPKDCLKYEIWSQDKVGLLVCSSEMFRSNIQLKHFSHCPAKFEHSYIVNGRTEPVTFSFVRDDCDPRFGRPYARIPGNIFEALSGYEYWLECSYSPVGTNRKEYVGPVFASYRSEEAAMLDLIQAKHKAGL